MVRSLRHLPLGSRRIAHPLRASGTGRIFDLSSVSELPFTVSARLLPRSGLCTQMSEVARTCSVGHRFHPLLASKSTDLTKQVCSLYCYIKRHPFVHSTARQIVPQVVIPGELRAIKAIIATAMRSRINSESPT